MSLAVSASDLYQWFERHGSACAKRTAMAVLLDVRGKAHFGFNGCASPQPSCPRGHATVGVGRDLCKEICKQGPHAEVAAVHAAGPDARGGVLYLYGHTHICQSCIRTLVLAGVVAYLCLMRKENEWQPVTPAYQPVPKVFPTS
jgi:deoxycytidylate deaminase